MDRLESLSNEKIKLAVKVASSVKARKETGLFFLEGLRLCRDAALTGAHIRYAFFSERAAEKFPEAAELISDKSEYSCFVSDAVCEKLSLTQNTQGFFCLCVKGADRELSELEAGGKYIALENIQDPANLGAICRTAEALGIDGAILSGCCDVLSPKSQRAAMGSLLRLPLYECENLKNELSELKKRGFKIYATTPDSKASEITAVSIGAGSVCVIGNEGNGVSEDVFSVSEKITIPMGGRAESLNASMAAAIVMWEMMR